MNENILNEPSIDSQEYFDLRAHQFAEQASPTKGDLASLIFVETNILERKLEGSSDNYMRNVIQPRDVVCLKLRQDYRLDQDEYEFLIAFGAHMSDLMKDVSLEKRERIVKFITDVANDHMSVTLTRYKADPDNPIYSERKIQPMDLQ